MGYTPRLGQSRCLFSGYHSLVIEVGLGPHEKGGDPIRVLNGDNVLIVIGRVVERFLGGDVVHEDERLRSFDVRFQFALIFGEGVSYACRIKNL